LMTWVTSSLRWFGEALATRLAMLRSISAHAERSADGT
jgi:hypothetical protein